MISVSPGLLQAKCFTTLCFLLTNQIIQVSSVQECSVSVDRLLIINSSIYLLFHLSWDPEEALYQERSQFSDDHHSLSLICVFILARMKHLDSSYRTELEETSCVFTAQMI